MTADPHLEKVYRAYRRPMTNEDWLELGWSHSEAEQYGREGEHLKEIVEVDAPGGTYNLPHYPYHSPSGFEWGYPGSGPSELARCILIDWFGSTPVKVGNLYSEIEPPLPVSYQTFKSVFLTGASKEGFTITGREIAAWVAAQPERYG